MNIMMSKSAIILSTVLIAVALTGGFLAGTLSSYPVGYKDGATVAYNQALADVAGLLQQQGITLDWHTNPDGSYTLQVITGSGQVARANIAVNLIVEWRDSNGKLLETGRGAGTFTTLGKNWTVAQLSSIANVVQSNTGVNATQYALWLADSTDMTGAAVGSEQLPNEITGSGLGRLEATSKTFISTGVFTCAVTKTAGATITPLGWGLNYAANGTYVKSLIAYDAGPGAKAMVSGDTLTETWTVTIS